MSTREKSYDYLIIGAGMAGLAAAHELRARGRESLVIDKGRGVGGRLATRWSDTPEGVRAVYDHGAQFFTVRSQIFRERVESWQRAGLVSEWARGFADGTGSPHADGHPRYVARGGMNALARDMAASLPVRLNSQVGSISWRNGWEVALTSGETISAASLILTPPVPQSLALLDAGGTVLPTTTRQELERIDYDPCFAVLVELESASRLPEPGALQLRSEPLAWIGDNTRKGVSPDSFTVTIHAGPDFTREFWDAPHELVAAKLLDAARQWLGPVRRWQVHRWRYSQPIEPHPHACLRVDTPGPLVFAGDAFGEPRVEGAFLSGVAAASTLD
jgi:renalase